MRGTATHRHCPKINVRTNCSACPIGIQSVWRRRPSWISAYRPVSASLPWLGYRAGFANSSNRINPTSYSLYHFQWALGNSPNSMEITIDAMIGNPNKYSVKLAPCTYIVIMIIPDTFDAQIICIVCIEMGSRGRFYEKRPHFIRSRWYIDWLLCCPIDIRQNHYPCVQSFSMLWIRFESFQRNAFLQFHFQFHLFSGFDFG